MLDTPASPGYRLYDLRVTCPHNCLPTTMSDLAITNDTAAILGEFTGGGQSDVSMMIGIGLVKDSDAVFFQYVGNDMPPQALMMPSSGRPLTRLANVRLVGINIAENVGEFNSTKLNLYLQSNQGRTIMITCGLTTLWSQYVLTGLMGLYQTYQQDSLFTLDSWKGTSKMKPCFAAIRVMGDKISDDKFKEQLLGAKEDGNAKRTETLMRDAVAAIQIAIGTSPIEDVVVTDESNEVDPEAAEIF